tara:strand:- start:575 stop:772 length:198 start_codon:yes stop_codon:yes gene_type:complete
MDHFKIIDREQVMKDHDLEIRIWNASPSYKWQLKVEQGMIITLLLEYYNSYDELNIGLDNFLRSL